MAVRGCSMNMIKYLMFFVNGLIALLAILVIVSCGLALSKQKAHGEIVDVGSSSYIGGIVIGAFIFLLAFLACCGACTENRTMLGVYAGFLIIMIIIGFALMIVVFVNRNKLPELVKKALDESVRDYYKKNDTKDMWDNMQKSLECCGASNGTKDFNEKDFPPSCCKDEKNCAPENAYKDTCTDKYQVILRYALGFAGVMMALIFVVMLFGVTFACCLRGAIHSNYQSY